MYEDTEREIIDFMPVQGENLLSIEKKKVRYEYFKTNLDKFVLNSAVSVCK